jgi:hypothetical protein
MGALRLTDTAVAQIPSVFEPRELDDDEVDLYAQRRNCELNILRSQRRGTECRAGCSLERFKMGHGSSTSLKIDIRALYMLPVEVFGTRSTGLFSEAL